MKRMAYCFFAAALALGFVACEGHNEETLPEKYQEKLGNKASSHEGSQTKSPASEHAAPAEGEKKSH
jgi:hypothetical protein